MISDDAKEVLLQRLAGLPTTVITDAMDRFGTLDPAIKPVWEGARVCGLASTVHSREGDNLGIHELLERAQPGRVVVVAAGGAISRALIGELIAERAVNAKVAGFVIDGAVRDVQGIEETGLPVFARGVSAAGPYRDGPYRLGRPVAVGGTVVNEDDIVCGDADGVVVVPLGRAEEVCQLAEEKMQLEVDTRAATIRSRS